MILDFSNFTILYLIRVNDKSIYFLFLLTFDLFVVSVLNHIYIMKYSISKNRKFESNT